MLDGDCRGARMKAKRQERRRMVGWTRMTVAEVVRSGPNPDLI